MSELREPTVKFGKPSTSTVPSRVTGGSLGAGGGGGGVVVVVVVWWWLV